MRQRIMKADSGSDTELEDNKRLKIRDSEEVEVDLFELHTLKIHVNLRRV